MSLQTLTKDAGLISATYDVYVDHKYATDHPTTLAIITGCFLQIARSSRYTAHPDSIPTLRVEYARVLSHAYATHLCPTHMYALTYDGTPATTTIRGNSVPGAPSALQEGPASRRRPSSSPLLPFRGLRDPPFPFSIREHLVEHAAPSNRILNRIASLVLRKRKKSISLKTRRII